MLVVPNFARTTLRASITPASTQLMLAIGGGAYFEIGSGNHMYVTIEDGQSVEIVKYTNTGPVVNDTITVERGQDGTTAKSFPAGACVKVAWNVAQVTELVEQTFINLFNTSVIPPNTIQVNAVPTAPPPANVIYAVWYAQKQFWYWNGSNWIELGNPRNGVLAGHGDPSGAPGNIVAFYVDLDSGALWYWTGTAWMSITGEGSTEEYWVRSLYSLGGGLGTVTPDQDPPFRLGDLIGSPTNRYRTYPGGVPTDSILELQTHGSGLRMTLTENAAMEVYMTIRGFFEPTGVPPGTPDAVMALYITNSSILEEWFADSMTVNAAWGPAIVLSVSTGVLTYAAGTFFDGNILYSKGATGTTWPNFKIDSAVLGFHVVEAGAVPG